MLVYQRVGTSKKAIPEMANVQASIYVPELQDQLYKAAVGLLMVTVIGTDEPPGF